MVSRASGQVAKFSFTKRQVSMSRGALCVLLSMAAICEATPAWQEWISKFGHDVYEYPPWIADQMVECKCSRTDKGSFSCLDAGATDVPHIDMHAARGCTLESSSVHTHSCTPAPCLKSATQHQPHCGRRTTASQANRTHLLRGEAIPAAAHAYLRPALSSACSDRPR